MNGGRAMDGPKVAGLWIFSPLLRLIDAAQPAEGPPPQRLVPFCRWALHGSERALGLSILVSLVAGVSEIYAAWFTGWAIDAAQAAGPGAFPGPLWPVVIAGLAFFLLIRPLIFSADASMTTVLVAPHLFPLVMSRITRHTIGHSTRYFENDFAGRISQKAMQLSRALTDVVVEGIDVVVYASAMFFAGLFLLGGVDLRILLLFGVWFVAWVLFLRFFIPRVQMRAAARAGARTAVSGQVVDTMSNITTVKLFAHDQYEDRITGKTLTDFRDRAVEFGVVSAVFRFGLMTLGGLLPLITILGVLWLWSRGAASAGDIAAVSMVATRLSQITNRVSMAFVQIFANVGEVQDGVETLSPPHEIADRPTAGALADPRGEIRFQDITFAYGGRVSALRDFSLTVAAGEKVALVGTSGAGKSTVTSLLLRLYDVEAGQVLLDGVDVRDLTQSALRSQIAVVRQETAMFNRSAFENIRYGRPDATEAEVYAAARRAEAHDFIQTLEDHGGRQGYDARLGERGVKLSGGQRQRIALARAILKDAPVLVLDEATSALDSEVEARIQSALADVMEGKTVIAIAHRLSTIASMDRIVVMEQGQIVEEGTHDGLLATGGAYADFWNRQSGGFLGVEAAE